MKVSGHLHTPTPVLVAVMRQRTIPSPTSIRETTPGLAACQPPDITSRLVLCAEAMPGLRKRENG